MAFDYDLDFDNINFREQPELYRVGRGEHAVMRIIKAAGNTTKMVK